MKNKDDSPAPIFQYRPPTMWALDNLFRRVIFFRSPLDFNDPYDCRTPPALDDLNDEQLDFLRRTNPQTWRIPPNNRSMPKAEFIAKVNKELRRRHKKVTKKCGVACFSKRNDNLLMWAHYAGGGKGFCLEFHNGDPALHLGYDVKYPSKFPAAYGYVETLARKWNQQYTKSQYTELLLTHKYLEWEYEEEVRMFRGKVGKLTYPPESLKAIYLGTEATDCTKQLIRAIIRERYKDVEIMTAELSKEKSGVNFTPIEK